MPWCGFKPQLLEHSDFGCNGKGAEAEGFRGTVQARS